MTHQQSPPKSDVKAQFWSKALVKEILDTAGLLIGQRKSRYRAVRNRNLNSRSSSKLVRLHSVNNVLYGNVILFILCFTDIMY